MPENQEQQPINVAPVYYQAQAPQVQQYPYNPQYYQPPPINQQNQYIPAPEAGYSQQPPPSYAPQYVYPNPNNLSPNTPLISSASAPSSFAVVETVPEPQLLQKFHLSRNSTIVCCVLAVIFLVFVIAFASVAANSSSFVDAYVYCTPSTGYVSYPSYVYSYYDYFTGTYYSYENSIYGSMDEDGYAYCTIQTYYPYNVDVGYMVFNFESSYYDFCLNFDSDRPATIPCTSSESSSYTQSCYSAETSPYTCPNNQVIYNENSYDYNDGVFEFVIYPGVYTTKYSEMSYTFDFQLVYLGDNSSSSVSFTWAFLISSVLFLVVASFTIVCCVRCSYIHRKMRK